MKVVLTQDMHKLGRAGDVKKVADGYARNYLIPQGLAIPATVGALKQVDEIKRRVAKEQEKVAAEMAGLAGRIAGLTLTFYARAAESGKLYGSVTPSDVVKALARDTGVEIDRRRVESEPLREIGTYQVRVRLAADLMPEVTVVILREGEAGAEPAPSTATAPAEAPVPEEATSE